jgi:hypothetical protein
MDSTGKFCSVVFAVVATVSLLGAIESARFKWSRREKVRSEREGIQEEARQRFLQDRGI